MTRARVRVVVLTVVIVLISLSNLAPANLMLNGSFEQPVVPPGGTQSFTAASQPQPPGWTVAGPGAVSIVSGTFTQSGFSFPAQDGEQWLDLTGFSSNQPTGVEQVVATVPGTTYDVSFWVGNVTGFLNPAATSSTVNLFIDGILALAATNTGGGTTLDWQQFTTPFTAAGPATTVGFFNGDPPGDDSNGLDNVVLTPRPVESVSEPALFLIVAAGLTGLVALRILKKRFQISSSSIS